MKQNISTLMDGELCGEEAETLLGRIKRHPDAQQDWVAYHLIGDVLRQPDYIHNDMSTAFFERLHAEPTVLAPRPTLRSRAGTYAMTAAASILAVVLLGWLSVQISAEPVYQQARATPVNMRNTSFPVNEAMNDYLLAHQEYSPSTDVRGAASYIRTVSVRRAGADQ